MKRAIAIGLVMAASLAAQSIDQLKLDHLKARAREHTELNLTADALGLAASQMKGDEAKAKALVAGLKGLIVRSYEFNRPGEYAPADVEQMRRLFEGPGWKRTVGVVGKHESFEVFVKVEGGKNTGAAMLSAEPKELTLVYFNGAVEIGQLADLAVRLGLSGSGKKGSK
jgi:hypothetical protein